MVVSHNVFIKHPMEILKHISTGKGTLFCDTYMLHSSNYFTIICSPYSMVRNLNDTEENVFNQKGEHKTKVDQWTTLKHLIMSINLFV